MLVIYTRFSYLCAGGTNYPAWYPFLAGDENMRFHFSLQFSQ